MHQPGSNSGSNFVLYRYTDDGVTVLSTPITVDRSNGNIGLNNPVFASAGITATDFYATHGYSLPVIGAFIILMQSHLLHSGHCRLALAV